MLKRNLNKNFVNIWKKFKDSMVFIKSRLNKMTILGSIFDLQFLISVLQESSFCLKYMLFIGFVVSPIIISLKHIKKKNIIML
jgi:hypothetical protein